GHSVAQALWSRALLQVLDNFEHLLDMARLVTQWLASCPGLLVLATSRERLCLQGEQVYPVLPLGVTDPAGGDSRDGGPGGAPWGLPTPSTRRTRRRSI